LPNDTVAGLTVTDCEKAGKTKAAMQVSRKARRIPMGLINKNPATIRLKPPQNCARRESGGF
jgi:hypothetical protein